MVKKIAILDYSITSQLVICILIFALLKFEYRTIMVYISFILFFSYWMIRIIFNPEYKEQISGG